MVAVGVLPPPGPLRESLDAVERSGLDHVVCGDHVSFIAGFGEDGLIRATALAMLGTRIEVHVGVYLLALRNPVLVARQLSTLNALAPGRLVLGVGVGGEDRHEVEVAGVDPRTRGRRMDECLEVLRALSSGEPVTYHGRFFDVTDARILPPFDVPILVGGRSDAAVRRAGRLGDGWLGIWVSPARFASVVEQTGAGRHAMQMWCAFADNREEARKILASRMEGFYRLPFERFERYSPYGTPEDVASFCAPYLEAGCETFNLLALAPDARTHVEGAAEVKRLLSRG